MQHFLFLNIVCISILGFISSYTDIKKGIIPNRLVFSGIAAAIALNFLNGFSLLPFLLNGSLAFLFGFMLWLAHLWSAGDAKLFLAFAVLFPMSFYSAGETFPAFAIILNSFAPAFLLLLLIVLFKTSAKQKTEALKQAFMPKLVISVIIFSFAFYWLLENIFSILQLPLDFFTAALLLFVVFAAAEALLPKKSVYFFALLSIIFLFLEFNSIATWDFLVFFFSFIVFALIFLFFILRLGFACFGKPIPLEKLEQGMVLLETIVEEKGKIAKKKQPLPSFVNIFAGIGEKQFVGSAGPKGLAAEEIALLQKAKREGKVQFDTVLIQETLPFAPIIFIGTIISFFWAF